MCCAQVVSLVVKVTYGCIQLSLHAGRLARSVLATALSASSVICRFDYERADVMTPVSLSTVA